MTDPGEWGPEAENWLRWARTPGHDAYWYYRDTFFDGLLPPPGQSTVEIGCGEGRVSRDLVARGHRVVAVDSSQALVEHARAEHTGPAHAVADGARLPFVDASFDLAVAYNVLQVVADMAGTVQEAARVLVPGGHFCFCVTHPITDIGRFADGEPGAAFLVRDDYFARRRVEDTVERDGLRMTFRGWTYSLEDYINALGEAGLQVQSVREPRPAAGPDRYRQWDRVPMFLMARCGKR